MLDFYRAIRPAIFALDPELAHGLTLKALKLGLVSSDCSADDPVLRTRVFGLDFPNPLGLAAGFDKNAEVLAPTLRLGFGFTEAGSVTPKPQPGNPKPRLFRIPQANAVINRMGFNNNGLEEFARRLEDLRGMGWPGIIGANVGRNKTTADAAIDYVAGIQRLAPLADYLVVNVSSPNTPGLRALQSREALSGLLTACVAARAAVIDTAQRRLPPLLLKVAPDLTDEDKTDIADVVLKSEIDGLIVSNTTIARPPSLPVRWLSEAGGLSGVPLFESSTRILREFHQLVGHRLPLIGAGGIDSGATAYTKILAGASLIQLYSALVFHGPGLLIAIKDDLARRLKADGFQSVSDAVGKART